jgi:hypothetical protein
VQRHELVESPVRGDALAGFGGRARETGRPKGQHRALVRPYQPHTKKVVNPESSSRDLSINDSRYPASRDAKE